MTTPSKKASKRTGKRSATRTTTTTEPENVVFWTEKDYARFIENAATPDEAWRGVYAQRRRELAADPVNWPHLSDEDRHLLVLREAVAVFPEMSNAYWQNEAVWLEEIAGRVCASHRQDSLDAIGPPATRTVPTEPGSWLRSGEVRRRWNRELVRSDPEYFSESTFKRRLKARDAPFAGYAVKGTTKQYGRRETRYDSNVLAVAIAKRTKLLAVIAERLAEIDRCDDEPLRRRVCEDV